MKKILFISSNQHFVDTFLEKLFNKLSSNFKIYLITNLKLKNNNLNNINVIHVDIKRKISIVYDLISLLKIIKIFFKIKPDILVTITPKSVIYGIILKFIKSKIKRIHIYTGITWSNLSNPKKLFFSYIDKLNIKFSNKILFDSKEQISFLMDNGIRNKNFFLINNGSITGVDTNYFYKYDNNTKNELRLKHNIPSDSKVILYLGRMDPDKGLLDLIRSFSNLNNLSNNFLLLVGKDEMNIKKYLPNNNKNIIYLNHVLNTPEIYNLADVFCLPSKREGFGNVIIESSSCEVPVVGSNIFGIKSSLINNFNGLTFEVGNIYDLTDKLNYLLENKDLRKNFGKNGRKFVKDFFNPNDVLKSLINLITN
mgnify:CR=1 FL=1